jgi:hypothetical protein
VAGERIGAGRRIKNEITQMAIDQDYLMSLSVEELRRELKHAWEVKYGLLNALRDAPEMPPPFVLLHLDHAAKWPEDNNLGKKLQRELGLDKIPPKSECEGGAGVWHRIRQGLTAPR